MNDVPEDQVFIWEAKTEIQNSGQIGAGADKVELSQSKHGYWKLYNPFDESFSAGGAREIKAILYKCNIPLAASNPQNSFYRNINRFFTENIQKL